jgi:(p)ppGpp synthase/HD superfamily hydrolase
MKLTKKIQKAINFCCRLHDGQVRKGDDGLPYASHPFSVAWILAEYTDDEDIIAAGLLHDVLEDVPGYRYEDMVRDFGERVAGIVKEVTEDKDPNVVSDDKATWEARKIKYLENLKNDSAEALMVCTADKIHNLRTMRAAYAEMGGKLWERFNAPAERKLWFYREIVKVLEGRVERRMWAELKEELWGLWQMVGMREYPAPVIQYADYDENDVIECPMCHWKGLAKDANRDDSEYCLPLECPECEKMILIADFPRG